MTTTPFATNDADRAAFSEVSVVRGATGITDLKLYPHKPAKTMKDRQLNLLVSSRLVLAAITTSLLLNGAQARTWTSADGTKTFEGELKSYDPRIAVVTVVLSNGNSIHLEQDKLSAADIAYLKAYFEEHRNEAAPSPPVVNLKDIPNVWPPKDEKPYGGKRLESTFRAELKSLNDEISRALPKVGGKGFSDLENAGKETAAAAANNGTWLSGQLIRVV